MAQTQNLKETTADETDKDSRNNSVVNEMGDMVHSGSNQTNSANLPQYCYTKEQLIEISKNELSKIRPPCLDPVYDNPYGMWDPERWFLGKRRTESPLNDDPKAKRDRPTEVERELSYKRRPSDPKERIKDEQDNIVLSPQRRSFGTGCHVSQQPTSNRRPESPADSRNNDRDSYRDPGRRIGSGRIISRDRDGRGQEFSFRANDRRDRDRFDRDERDVRFNNRSSGYGERKSTRGRQHHEKEEEPEWYSGGPTSQSETIELHGFEDIPEEEQEDKTEAEKEESSEPKGKRRRRSSNWRKNKSVLEENDIPEEDEEKGEEDVKENGKSSGRSSSTSNQASKENENTQLNNEFDVNKMFEVEGIFQNGTPPESWGGQGGGSRFSQFFRVESPGGGVSSTGSRRSSLQEELGNLLNGGNSDAYFQPIAPAQKNASSKHIMDLLQNAETYPDDGNFKTSNLQELTMSGQACNVQELEAGLKELVLGSRRNSESSNSVSNGPFVTPTEEMPAFKKLLAQFSEDVGLGSNDSGETKDEDLIQMGKVQMPSTQSLVNMDAIHQSPVHLHNNTNLMNILKNAPTEQDILAGHVKAQPVNHQTSNSSSNQSAPYPDFLAQLFQQQQQQNQENSLSKILGPTCQDLLTNKRAEMQQNSFHGLANGQLNRICSNDVSSKMSQQQQREILANIVKQQQQQHQQLHAVAASQFQPASPPAPILRPLSPRPPSPQQAMFQQQQQQQQQQPPPRIPSPLVFGQTPPILSHAPSPIHPSQMMAPIIPINSNTLQVYNQPMIQRCPSPQELVFHTQQIMQNALIKSKLEEQKEKFRKRQELQRSNVPTSKISSGGGDASPSKMPALSSTMAAFTPTSVMRKMQAEKEKEIGKGDGSQNNASMFKAHVVSTSEAKMALKPPTLSVSVGNNLLDVDKVPRPLHGQGLMHSQIPAHRGTNVQNCGPQYGRPIVKGNQGMEQLLMSKGQQTNAASGNKNFATNFDLNKLLEQQRVLQTAPRQLNAATPSSLPPHPTGGYSMRGSAGIHANLNRSAINMAPPNVLRNVIHPSVNTAALRAQLNQLALLQQCNIEPQVSAPHYLHPVTLHHILRGQPMARSQPPSNLNLHGTTGVTKPDSQNFAGNFGVGSLNNNLSLNVSNHGNLQSSPTSNNLVKWFGNDLLQQKLPDLSSVPTQKALSLEEVERHQQQKTAVHN